MSNKDIEINIKLFDIKKIKKDSIIICIGRRGTGKSFLIKDILYHNRDIPMGTVISHTDHLQHYYDKFIPTMLIYKKYEASTLENLFKRQTKAITEKWKDPNAFLLLDDCLGDAKNWSKDEWIKETFFNGRWYKLLFICAMQAPMGIPPSFRTNIDYTFLLKNNNTADREKIYKHYAGVFPSREMFDSVMDTCTEDHNCLVIDNTSTSNKLEDQVFFYKAKDNGPFKICSKKIWELNNDKYNQDVSFNNSNSYTTKKNTKITVKKIK
jgi:hypothetical protein